MQRKIIVALILIIVVVSVTLSIISYVTIHASIDRSLQNRLVIARIIADTVEVFLNRSIIRLHDVSSSEKIDLADNDWAPEQRMLETVYKYSLFTEGVFLLDTQGNKLLTYPPHIELLSNLSYITHVNDVLRHGRPAISDVFTIEPVKKKVVFVMTPMRNHEGKIIGIAGGMLSPADDFFHSLLKTAKTDPNTYAEMIDSKEVVIASDNPSRVLQHHDHDSVLSRMIKEGQSGILECKHGFSHADTGEKSLDLLAFAPLRMAPWGIILGQSEHEVFAPALALQREFVLLVLVFLGVSLFVSVVMSRKIVSPLKSLTYTANRIAGGDLSTPVGNLGSDEILTLSRSFDEMRERLAESLEKIRTQNLELESRVVQRTQQIRAGRQRIEDLLKRVISSQEDERRRVARELHDTILQDVSAFLIKLEICRMHPERIDVGTIDEMRDIATETIDNIHAVISDLRPTLIDDLGLNAGVRWLLNRHLRGRGIEWQVDVVSPLSKRLPPTVEISVFRILQEAIVNIARHAHAKHVSVTVDARKSSLLITVEDDGRGFDYQELIRTPSENGRGLGILGMKERASLVEGRLQIVSLPGTGTKLSLDVPLEAEAGHE
jgi:signal transduction histidine kinase